MKSIKKLLIFIIFCMIYKNNTKNNNYKYNIYCLVVHDKEEKEISAEPLKIINIKPKDTNSPKILRLYDYSKYTSSNLLKLLFPNKITIEPKTIEFPREYSSIRYGSSGFLANLISLTVNPTVNNFKNNLDYMPQRHIFATGALEKIENENYQKKLFHISNYLKFNQCNFFYYFSLFNVFYNKEKLKYYHLQLFKQNGSIVCDPLNSEIKFREEVKQNLILITLLKQYNYKIEGVGALKLKLLSIIEYLDINKINSFVVFISKKDKPEIETFIKEISIKIEDYLKIKKNPNQYNTEKLIQCLNIIKNIFEKSIIYIESSSDLEKLQDSKYLDNLYTNHENNENINKCFKILRECGILNKNEVNSNILKHFISIEDNLQ